MKANSLRVTGLLLALSVSCASILSCQQTFNNLPQTSGAQQALQTETSVLNLDTGHGNIRLHIALPVPKAYQALKDYHGFKTQFIEEKRINRIRVTITGVSTDFLAERTIPISQGGMTATIKVPLGKNFLLRVQGMDDLNEVPGALVKSVFTVESSETVPDVDVTPLTTAVAEVVERVRAQNRAAAVAIDTDKLKALIEEGKSAANPFLVNFNAFATVITAANGQVPSIVPANPVLRPGVISGTLTGLLPGDAAVIFSNDPVSEPFIVVAPPLGPEDTAGEVEVPYRIDNVPPGNWVVRVVASGYQVQGDEIELLGELSATQQAQVTSNTAAELDFEVLATGWGRNPTNASGNIGSSDQPRASVDGADHIHLVWRQDGFQNNEESGSVFYSRWNGLTWSTNNRFISPPGDNKYRGARNPVVAAGVDRTPNVLWSANSNNSDFRGRRVLFSRFDGARWSEPLVISTEAPQTEVSADNPDVAVNPINGQVFGVWDQLNNGVRTVYISQLQNGQWLQPIQLSDNSTASVRPRLTIGTDGWIRIVWEVQDSSRVQYIEWDGTRFGAIEEVPFNQSAEGQRDRNLAAAIDRLNRLHLIRRVDNTIQYLFRSNNSWSRAEYVHEVAGQALPVLSDVSLALDGVGNVNAAWGSALTDGTQVIRYRKRTNLGWTLPEGFVAGQNNNGSQANPFPTPTPQPTAPTPPQANPTTESTPFPGYEDLPLSRRLLPGEEPQVVVDSRARISVLWSNSGSDVNDSEIYHSLKSQPIQAN